MKISDTAKSMLSNIKKVFMLLFIVALVKSVVMWLTEFMFQVFLPFTFFRGKLSVYELVGTILDMVAYNEDIDMGTAVLSILNTLVSWGVITLVTTLVIIISIKLMTSRLNGEKANSDIVFRSIKHNIKPMLIYVLVYNFFVDIGLTVFRNGYSNTYSLNILNEGIGKTIVVSVVAVTAVIMLILTPRYIMPLYLSKYKIVEDSIKIKYAYHQTKTMFKDSKASIPSAVLMLLFYVITGAIVVTVYGLFIKTIGSFMPWVVKDFVAEIINAAAFSLLMIFDITILKNISVKKSGFLKK